MKHEPRLISTAGFLSLLVLCFIWYTNKDLIYKKLTYGLSSPTNSPLHNAMTISWSHFTVSDRLPGFIYKVSIPKCGTFFTSSLIDRVELQNMPMSDWLVRTLVDDSGVDHVPHLFKFVIRETVALIDSDPHIPVFWYEDLVGAQGGGSDKIRVRELTRLAWTVGLGACAGRAAHEIMNQTNAHLPGSDHTYRKGLIGEWKTVFNATHFHMFNAIYGRVFSRMGRPLIERMDNY